MRTIHKIQLSITERQTVYLPRYARVLTIQLQAERPTIWYEFERGQVATEKRYFQVVGTGHDAPDPDLGSYVGTIQDGDFVWHFYERFR